MDVNQLQEQFLQALWLEQGLSQHTLSAYKRDLQHFFVWAKSSDLNPLHVSTQDLQNYLQFRLSKNIHPRTSARNLSCLKSFYRYLVREKKILSDPTKVLQGPKIIRTLPHSLSENDVEKLLNAPNISEPIGLRDKAMLEVLYACGLRVSELINLTLNQLNLKQGVFRVLGKGSRERLVPIGMEAIRWLERYLKEARSYLLDATKTVPTSKSTAVQSTAVPSSTSTPLIFVSQKKGTMTRQAFWYRIKIYALQAGITADISPHTLRHAFATHLINHHADLRVVQMLLGHSSLSTTQIYTHMANQWLQELHSEHHPRG